jgi:hypothetical protein
METPPTLQPPLSVQPSATGDAVMVTDNTGAQYTYVYMAAVPTCPTNYHPVWTGAGWICVHN